MTNNTNTYFDKLPLDNAAKIYPAAMTKKWNAVFGISAHLVDDVNVLALRKAVVDLVPRFPSLYVRLKKELFWDVFVPATDFDIVQKSQGSPCRLMDVKNTEKPLFRVMYLEKEIRVEFFHSLTDGTGAFEYLKSLMYVYFKNCSHKKCDVASIKVLNGNDIKKEIADDFQAVYKKGVHFSRKDSNAYQLKLEEEENYLSSTKICLPINELKSVSKTVYHCTITQYVATVYALALLNEYENDKEKSNKPVKLSIPVNLRHYFDSSSIRNFASYVTINVTPTKEYTFENVLELITNGMKEKITKDNMFKSVCQNVADEKMIISKYSPNSIKKFFMRQAFNMYGEKKYTSTVTNIGLIKPMAYFDEKISYFSATLGATALNKINCAVAGYKNTLCVNISSVSKNTSIQNYFVDFVKKDNIEVEIEKDFNNYNIKEKIAG